MNCSGVYAKNAELGAMAGAMLMPIVTLAQNRAAKILVNVAAVSVILGSFICSLCKKC